MTDVRSTRGAGGKNSGVAGASRLRVLVVARWYPAHDDPGRGRFVADHVAALSTAGVEAVVASFEPVFVRGDVATRAARVAMARVLYAEGVRRRDALQLPGSWGAGVPVARLPVVLDAGERSDLDEAEAHAAVLGPFADALGRRWPFDVVHAHTGLPDGVAASSVARRLGLPLLVTEHDSTIGPRLRTTEARNAYADLLGERRILVAVSQSLASEVTGALGIDDARIGVLPNPVAVDDYGSVGGPARDPDELLYVGNRKASKGIETLLRAFARLRAERPALRLRLIGSSPEPADEEWWWSLADELGIAAATSFEPPCDRAGVAAAMARASVFVHPSPRETFGVVAAEALAAGLPVAAAPSGGVREILGTSGDYGEVASDPGPEALATAIGRVLDRRASFDPALLRARVEQYSAARVAERTRELYRSLVDPNRTRAFVDTERGAALPLAVGSTPLLVVALSRPDAARLIPELPAAAVAELTVVTTQPGSGGAAAQPAVLPAGPRWIEIDPDATYLRRLARLGSPLPRGASPLRRALAFLRNPLAARSRRRLFGQREALRDADLMRGIVAARDAVASGATTTAAAPMIVAVDADDALRARVLLDRGARLAPGSLRWLADRWDGSLTRAAAASSETSTSPHG